mmetsp:Transcript_11387/g.24030  ORF Transcript_11387/g.24030 Transcript_11387/m.24030 type:complete len:89 (-) Transcript_11387:157-423(-)
MHALVPGGRTPLSALKSDANPIQITPSSTRTMERREGSGGGKCVNRGWVDNVVDKFPLQRAGVPSAAAAAATEGNAKMEHHQWYPATQ